MHSVAVVQARMGSSRLPGKVMMQLAGRPVLDHVVTRVTAATRLDSVVVATSDLPGDDIIEDYCLGRGWACVRGSESDVLSRYVNAVRTSGAEVVARVTSDCPLFSPRILDEMLAAFDAQSVDYMSTNWPERSFPVGLDCEVFTAEGLFGINDATNDSYEREHVTPHFYRNPERYRLAGYRCARQLAHLSITLDTRDDYERLVELLDRRPEAIDTYADIVGIAAEHFGRFPPHTA